MAGGLGRAAVVMVAVVTGWGVVGVGALADPGGSSHVDEVTAVLGAGGVTVTGQATFVDVPVIVGDDPVSDARATVVPLGHELTTATISRPDPFGDTVRFTLRVANQPPQVNGVPETIVYRWRFTVTGPGDLTRTAILSAWRTRQIGNVPNTSDPVGASTNPSFKLQLGNLRRVSGEMGDGVVAWDVPIVADFQPGQGHFTVGNVFTSENDDEGVQVLLSSSLPEASDVEDTALGENSALDEMTTGIAYTVPGPSVRMGIAPAGTPAQDIPLTTVGTVDASGTFRGHLPTPATSGEYAIAVQACHGTDSCGIATTNVTV